MNESTPRSEESEQAVLLAGPWTDHGVSLYLGSVYNERSPAQKLCANVRSHAAVCQHCGPEQVMGWTCLEAARVWLKNRQQEPACQASQTLMRYSLVQVLRVFTELLRSRC